MPLYYLFGLDGIEPSSFCEIVFLVAHRWFVAALQGTLIGSSFLLVILIRNKRARDNARLVARGVDEDGARGGPPPRLILRRFAPAE